MTHLAADDHEEINKKIGRIILLFADESLSDSMTMGEIRKLAFKILPEASIRSIVKKMKQKENTRKLEK